MAIRRCPYCKAIIDEGSEYCSNCGTQLIFPEDEYVDEEIPGEKIIDVNEEGSQLQEEQDPEKEKDQSTKGKKRSKKASEGSKQEEEYPTESNVEEAEIEAKEPKPETLHQVDSDAMPDEKEIAEAEKEQFPDSMQEEASSELQSGELLEPKEELSQKVEEEAEAEVEEVATQEESTDFRTEDLAGMVDPAEKEKEEIEKFLDSLKEEREKTKKYYEETGELPPWAQSMREGTASEAQFEEDEEFGEEPIVHEGTNGVEDIEEASAFKESFREEKIEPPSEPRRSPEPEEGLHFEEEVSEEKEDMHAADTGMGLPEGVDQQSLPFSRGIFESTTGREKKRRAKRLDVAFVPWIKSRIFDVIIIAGIWLVGLWLASRVVGIGFFRLLTTSAVETLLLFVILLIIYFFLFLFFLGETLGDHLFSEES